MEAIAELEGRVCGIRRNGHGRGGAGTGCVHYLGFEGFELYGEMKHEFILASVVTFVTAARKFKMVHFLFG